MIVRHILKGLMKGVFPCFGVCWQNVNNSFLTTPFFFRNREGFVLGKQGICLHQHALASYIITQCILRSKSVNFISFIYLYIQISKFRKSFECLSAKMHLFLFVFKTGNRKIKSCNLFCSIAAERVEKLCSTFSIQNKLIWFVGTQV